MTGTELKILDFLAAGVSQRAAAAASGVSESFVSQLMASEDFLASLADRRSAGLQESIEFDSRLDKAEDVVLRRIEATVGMITDPMKAVKALQMLSTVKRRNGVATQDSTPATIVTLDLPESSKVTISMSQDKQVIAIGGRSTATLPSRNLGVLLAERKKSTQAIEVSSKIPQDLL